MALDRGRRRRGLIASAAGGRGHRHASLQPARSAAAQGHAARKAARRRGRASTSTTARSSGASPAMGRARSASSPRRGHSAHLQAILPDCDLSSAPRRRSTSPAAATDTVAALAPIRRGRRRRSWCKRGADGLRRLARRHSRSIEMACPARASRSRSSTCWAPAMPSWPGSCAAG